jgi:DNA-directed RNA polymerase subunit beta'
MPKLKSTVGQIMVNDVLPEDMQDRERVLDKKGLAALLREVGEKHPEKYRDISFKLNQIGRQAAYTSGGNSFGLEHMQPAKGATARRKEIGLKIQSILNNDSLSDEARDRKLIELAGGQMEKDREEIYEESISENNPLAMQLKGAGRGNKMNLQSLRGSDWLYQDHRGNVIPVPVTRSYAQGLSPLEYWAGTYGARQGVISTKFATQEAGFLSKQLNQIAHRLVVTDNDGDGEPDTMVGLPADINDSDNEGALLARNTGGYKRNTVLTPKILGHLRKQGIKRLLLRSPAVSGAPDGGLYARDVGVREFGQLPVRGEIVGLTAAQALSEPISQGQLSAKHAGGVAGASGLGSGFDFINQLVQVPKKFKGGAAHSALDGTVQSVEAAPAGGQYVTIGNEKHYVGEGFGLSVKKGDKVEAGDVISEGFPNPALITRYKGVGEGRRYFINAFADAMRNSGMRANRRNIELLSRGLINHVRLTDEIGDFAPDDVVSYSTLANSYRPREGHEQRRPREAVGQYLEKPYLHYSIGTKVKPSMLKDFQEFGVNDVVVHREAPPFEPEMIRGMGNLHHDEDWQTRMFGSGLKGTLLQGVHRGGTSDTSGTSFVPSRAKAVEFGESGIIQTPQRMLNMTKEEAPMGP